VIRRLSRGKAGSFPASLKQVAISDKMPALKGGPDGENSMDQDF